MTWSALAPMIGKLIPYWIGFFFLLVAVVVLRLFLESRLKKFFRSQEKKLEKNSPETFRFELESKTFFTQSESVFYKQLLGALHGQPFVIFPKVRLYDLFDIVRNENSLKARNKISQKHVDYVIVALPACQPVLAIELDGSSHNSQRQRARDTDKDAAFKSAGLPLIRVRTDEKPNLERLLSAHLMLERQTAQKITQ